MKIRIRRNVLTLLVVLIVAASAFELGQALSAPSRNLVQNPGSGSTPCTYDNFIDGGMYVAKDCKTGAIAFKESTPFALWTDTIATNESVFFESGTWDFCANGGVTEQIIGLRNLMIWGIYNQTIFKCSANSGDALIVGNQNVNTNALTAWNIHLHDLVFDGGYPGTGSTGSAFSISNAFDVNCDRCIFQNAGNIGGGTVAMAIYNSNQGGSQYVSITNSVFVKQKLSLEGERYGGIYDSFFTGTAPGVTNQGLVAFSIGDIFPLSVERMEDFCFCRNHITGWTSTLMDGFQSEQNATIADNYFANGFTGLFKTVDVTGPRLNGLTIRGNTFTQGTGVMQFRYGNDIRVLDNTISNDNTAGGCSIAVQIGNTVSDGNHNVNNVTISRNTIVNWGGAGMDLNFSRGLVSDNTIYNVNQGNCNANSDPGIEIDKGLNHVQIINNQIISTPSSGAGTSKPIYYAGAGTNDVIANNFLDEHACGDNVGGCGINFAVTADPTLQVYNNWGFNSYGKLGNFIFASGNNIGLCGTQTGITLATAYTVCGFPLFITSTGGASVSITIQDNAGNTLASGLATLQAQYLPIGYRIDWVTGTGMTVTVAGV